MTLLAAKCCIDEFISLVKANNIKPEEINLKLHTGYDPVEKKLTSRDIYWYDVTLDLNKGELKIF